MSATTTTQSSSMKSQAIPQLDPRFVSQPRCSRTYSSSRSSSDPILHNRALSAENISEWPVFNGIKPCGRSELCSYCVTECVNAGCPDIPITPECTDQCIVIPCSDPSHSDANAHPCDDSSCHIVTDCVDCGLQELFDCCTDFHQYFSEPKNTAPEYLQLDASLQQFLRGCREMSDANHDEQRGQMQSRDDFQPNVSQKLSAAAQQDSMSSQIHFQPAPSGMGQSPTLDMCTAEFPASSQPAPSLHQTCHWGDCQATFQTLPDLVAHVNLEHLQIPEAAPLGALSCLWRDCANPDSLPGPSTGSHLRDALTSHLFQDHLHVYCPSASASPLDPPSQGEQNGGVAEHSSALISYSTSDVLTSSATTHRCRWQGCSLEFALLDELTAHLAAAHVGSGRAHYECFWEGCERNGERGFTSKQKICRHLQSHTGHRPFQCDICKLYFSEAATLQQHMRRHTQEKPYRCDFPGCGKAFATTGALTIHKRTHNGVKPFKCTYCEKAFSESSNLAKHLRTHTGLRPYACQHQGCGKTFARADQLTRHMGTHKKN